MLARALERVRFFALFFALSIIALTSPTIAADGDMVWSFSEGNDASNRGRMTARLGYSVPETDNALADGVCEARSGSSNSTASLILGADTGKLEEGSSIKVRFSGGGFEHTVNGIVFGTRQEEGISGVALDINVKDKLWKALTSKDSIDYQIPGYSSSKLKLKQGHTKIRQFIRACRDYTDLSGSGVSTNAKPEPVKKVQAKPEPKIAEPKKAASGSTSQKEAFDSAKELGTLEAWEAFLTNFPTGFRAELARAYLKRLGGSAPTASSAPAAPSSDTPPPPPPPAAQTAIAPPPPLASPADISISTTANQTSCKGGDSCSYTVVATNNGGTAFSGELVIANSLAPRGATLTSPGNAPWFCQSMGGGAVCSNPAANIAPGASTNLSLTFKLPRRARGSVTSCASISWGGVPTASTVRDVQQALNGLGQNVGRPDGKAGRKTRTAIRAYQQQNGLQETGEVDLPLLIAMFTVPGAGDGDPINDQSCTGSSVIPVQTTFIPRPQVNYCGGGRVLDPAGRCACPATFPHWTGKSCLPRRVRNCRGGTYYSKRQKLCLCPSRKPFWYNNRCRATLNECPEGGEVVGNTCVQPEGPKNQIFGGGQQAGCPSTHVRIGNVCVNLGIVPVFGKRRGGRGGGGGTAILPGGGAGGQQAGTGGSKKPKSGTGGGGQPKTGTQGAAGTKGTKGKAGTKGPKTIAKCINNMVMQSNGVCGCPANLPVKNNSFCVRHQPYCNPGKVYQAGGLCRCAPGYTKKAGTQTQGVQCVKTRALKKGEKDPFNCGGGRRSDNPTGRCLCPAGLNFIVDSCVQITPAKKFKGKTVCPPGTTIRPGSRDRAALGICIPIAKAQQLKGILQKDKKLQATKCLNNEAKLVTGECTCLENLPYHFERRCYASRAAQQQQQQQKQKQTGCLPTHVFIGGLCEPKRLTPAQKAAAKKAADQQAALLRAAQQAAQKKAAQQKKTVKPLPFCNPSVISLSGSCKCASGFTQKSASGGIQCIRTGSSKKGAKDPFDCGDGRRKDNPTGRCLCPSSLSFIGGSCVQATQGQFKGGQISCPQGMTVMPGSRNRGGAGTCIPKAKAQQLQQQPKQQLTGCLPTHILVGRFCKLKPQGPTPAQKAAQQKAAQQKAAQQAAQQKAAQQAAQQKAAQQAAQQKAAQQAAQQKAAQQAAQQKAAQQAAQQKAAQQKAAQQKAAQQAAQQKAAQQAAQQKAGQQKAAQQAAQQKAAQQAAQKKAAQQAAQQKAAQQKAAQQAAQQKAAQQAAQQKAAQQKAAQQAAQQKAAQQAAQQKAAQQKAAQQAAQQKAAQQKAAQQKAAQQAAAQQAAQQKAAQQRAAQQAAQQKAAQQLQQQGQQPAPPPAQSDIRLKKDVVHLTTLESGIKLYSFRYLWSEQVQVGVMAQDLLLDPVHRDAVVLQTSGYYAVDYTSLGLRMVTFDEWKSQGVASVLLKSPDHMLGALSPGVQQ